MKDGSTTGAQAMFYRCYATESSQNVSIVVQVNVHARGRDGSSSRYVMHLAGSPESCERFISHVVPSSQQYYLFLNLAELLVRVEPLSEAFTSSTAGAAT
jgi:hypothetical protein